MKKNYLLLTEWLAMNKQVKAKRKEVDNLKVNLNKLK